jgi:hypothetical protein
VGEGVRGDGTEPQSLDAGQRPPRLGQQIEVDPVVSGSLDTVVARVAPDPLGQLVVNGDVVDRHGQPQRVLAVRKRHDDLEAGVEDRRMKQVRLVILDRIGRCLDQGESLVAVAEQPFQATERGAVVEAVAREAVVQGIGR